MPSRNAVQQRRYAKKVKQDLFTALGGVCCRCGFADVRALQVDHVHGGGRRERGQRGYTNNYRQILREVRLGSSDYQLLCANCNWIKRWENDECAPLRDPAHYRLPSQYDIPDRENA